MEEFEFGVTADEALDWSAKCCGVAPSVTRSSRFVILTQTFAAKGRHSLLWPEATTFERSQRVYMRRPPQIVVAKGRNI